MSIALAMVLTLHYAGSAVVAASPKAPLTAANPGLDFSRLLGTGGTTRGLALAVRQDGAIYVAGTTTTTNWPGSFWPTSGRPGEADVFVALLSADGETIERVLRFGGINDDRVTGIHILSHGLLISGVTRSPDFPQTTPVTRSVEHQDLFVARLDLQLEALQASVVLGGNHDDDARSALLQADGELWLAGTTASTDFPHPENPGVSADTKDGFLVHVDTQSLQIEVALRLEGSGQDEISGIAEDRQGRILVTGSTDSADFPTSVSWPQHNRGGLDAFLVVMEPDGLRILQSGPLGGEHDDRGNAIAVDTEGTVWIAGTTASETLGSSFLPGDRRGAGDALLIRVQLSPTVSTTFRTLGGSGSDSALALVLGNQADLWIGGQTTSADFPALAPVQGPHLGSSTDVFIARIETADLQSTFVSKLGSSAVDTVATITTGQNGSVLLAGSTAASTRGYVFPTTPVAATISAAPPLQPSSHAFVARVALPGVPSAADDFPNPKTMVGHSWTALGDLASATREPEEPGHAGASAEHSLWWRWVATGTGPTVVSTVGSQSQTRLGVYRGNTLADLTSIAANAQDPIDPWSSRTSFTAQAGEVYHIAVDSASATLGAVQLTLFHGIPPNDDFRYRIPAAGLPLQLNGTNTGATEEPEEPLHAETPGHQSVWWSWQAGADGAVRLDTQGSDFGTPLPNALALVVYQGHHVSNLTAIASNNGGRKRFTVFSAIRGEAYQIAIDGLQYWPYTEPGSTGAIALSFQAAAPPANDRFDNAVVIEQASLPFAFAGSLAECSSEPTEPRFPFTAQRSRWWRWDALHSGNMQVIARGASQPHVGIFQGTSLANLEPVLIASPQRGETEGARAIFRAVSGTRYYLMVDGDYYSSPDDFTFQVESVSAPPNDDFADATLIEGAIARFDGDNSGASLESKEPETVYQGFSSVWWRWTAPSNGTARVRILRSHWPGLVVLSAFAGSSLADLQPVGGNHSQRDVRADCYPCLSELVSFPAQQGMTYALSVSGFGSTTGSFDLIWELLQPPPNDLLSQALALEGLEAFVEGTTTGATANEREPAATTQHPGGQSVWWSWTAPSSGTLRLSLVDAAFPLILAVHTRNETGQLETLSEGILTTNALEVAVAGDLDYLISADSPGAQGPFRWHLLLRPALQMGWSTAVDGQLVGVILRGTATGPIRIDTSDNLRSWTPWQTNHLVHGLLEARIATLPGVRHRFFRALELP